MVFVIGVIGGSGFYTFFGDDARSVNVDTPYGEPSAPITVGQVGSHQVAFLPRHGLSHEHSPHTVPYRANMWALRALGVRRVFGPCAVGSLTVELGPGAVVVPDQLVDRTRGRMDTYVDSGGVMQTEFNVALPWSKEVSLSAPAKSSASVAVVNVGRDVTCSVSVNGSQVRQRSGRGLTICTGAA